MCQTTYRLNKLNINDKIENDKLIGKRNEKRKIRNKKYLDRRIKWTN